MALRPELGDFCSIICTKAIIKGIQDVLGEEGAATVFIRAGRVRGEQVAKDTGLAGAKPDVSVLAGKLNEVFGVNGTKLCIVDEATQDGDAITIKTRETVCSAGEAEGTEMECSYTLGAVWGALEASMGVTYQGKQTGCVLTGGCHDTFVFTPLD